VVEKLLTIGEVSRRSGVAASALRFYEDAGPLRSERALGGARRYQRTVLRRIAVHCSTPPTSCPGRAPAPAA